jgi:RimJ/RimL family protein N-acetyltransferase
MLRPATDDDLADMLTWRNQETNRAVSIQSHVITGDEHRAWWERVKKDPTREVHMFVSAGRTLGVVTYFDIDRDARSASWGFYLDSETTEAEGIGLTAWMQVMGDGVDHAFDVLGVDVLLGEVLGHNEAVRMMNRRFRFAEGEPEQRELDGRTVEVIPIRLDRAQRRTRKTTGSRSAE